MDVGFAELGSDPHAWLAYEQQSHVYNIQHDSVERVSHWFGNVSHQDALPTSLMKQTSIS